MKHAPPLFYILGAIALAAILIISALVLLTPPIVDKNIAYLSVCDLKIMSSNQMSYNATVVECISKGIEFSKDIRITIYNTTDNYIELQIGKIYRLKGVIRETAPETFVLSSIEMINDTKRNLSEIASEQLWK